MMITWSLLLITPPYNFIFNNYKTNDKYGQQEIPVMDDDVINLIKQYIAYN
jgi:hypothetical protein